MANNPFPGTAQWLVTGVHRRGPLRGCSCSAAVYTAPRAGRSTALQQARDENHWMRVDDVRRVDDAPTR